MTLMDAKRNFVIDEAISLFLERSVPGVTIKDIAKSSGLGEATIYRYFSGRGELVLACALKLQSDVERVFLSAEDTLTGYGRMEKFFRCYLDLFLLKPGLYKFLNEFDASCVSEGIDGLDEYADNMDKFKAAFDEAYEKGLRDGTVRRLESPDVFYYSTTHSVLSLCKKLASEAILRQDLLTDKAQEISALIDIILFSLKNEKNAV